MWTLIDWLLMPLIQTSEVDVEDLMCEFMGISAPFAIACLSSLRDEGLLLETARLHSYKVAKKVSGQ